jgi:hypothetical protein
VLERAGQQLPFEINGDEPRAGINRFVAGHDLGSKQDVSMTLDIPAGSRQDAHMNELFLQRR